MKMTGQTVLVTGGGSGIGRALAEAFHGFGNQVIIAGRRREVLEEVTRANPGMKAATLDVQDAAKVEQFAAEIARDYPALSVLINNAGVMKAENLLAQDQAVVEATITTNLLAPIRLTSALLPLLRRQAEATVINVTSGLAYTPLAMAPTYCATKAAMHSYSESLRWQLRQTPVEVLELAPPYVQTELMGPGQAADPRAMPLGEFISEVMSILTNQPEAREILVERVRPLRFAAERGAAGYEEFFRQFNGSMAH